ncbi:S1C family serine protease [Jeotgalibaca porci]|uniref:S1C family serine protease n=1 Tax=Jeotgalibaca porci TaxID=1868793 RepID=UPI0016A46A04|nr:PDZ domain-containing protein [Lactobacillales bacterium]
MSERYNKQPKKQSGIKNGIVGGIIGGATVALLGTGILFGSGTLEMSKDDVDMNKPVVTEEATSDSGTTNVSLNITTATTEAVESVQEAVVSVINLKQNAGNPFGFVIPQTESSDDDDLVTNGTGSGVIYKKEDGTAYVVTNNHVISGADAVEVLMKDGTKIEAEIVGADVWTDLAVLAISSEHVDVIAEFGNSDNLNVGEPAIAIGSPLGTEFATSVTQGIVSATERTVETDINGDGVVDWDVTAIQTDASINPGNSGGALINIGGQVIGINSMKIASSNVEGMGFAIPSNDVVRIIAELEANGEVIRPVLGVSMMDLQQVSVSQQRNILKLPEDVTTGVVVSDVQGLSAASEAGIEQYDVIVGMDGDEITNMVELRKILYRQEVGATVPVDLYRNGERMTISVKLTDGQEQL